MASINTFEWHPGYIVPMLYLCHIVNTMTSTKLLEPSLIFSAETKIDHVYYFVYDMQLLLFMDSSSLCYL